MPHPDTEATESALKEFHDAKRAHQVAISELEQLRAKVSDGAEVAPAELTEAAAKVEHAQLRIEAKHRALANTRMRARKQSMAQLALEIVDYDTETVAKSVLADFGQIEEAVNELIKRVRVHNTKVSEWRQWAADLGAQHPEYSTMPPSCNAGVGVQTNIGAPNAIQIDDQMVCHVDPAELLVQIVEALNMAAGSGRLVDLTERGKAMARGLVREIGASGRAGDWITAAHFRDGE
jgi:hypothetical protein